MINAEEVQALINLLPNLFIYIVPGFIFIEVYDYVFNSKRKELKNYILDYVIASFIINSMVLTVLSIINSYWQTSYDLTNYYIQSIICFVSLVLAYFIAKIMKSEIWTNIMINLGINRNNASNIFSDIIDYEYGTWVRVYLNNEKIVYDGALIKFHYKDSYNDSLIVLEQYETYEYGKNELDKSLFNNNGKPTQHVAIKVSEISRIEVTYNQKSAKLFKKEGKQRLKFLSKRKYEKIILEELDKIKSELEEIKNK
ncbi:hypothetical protein FDB24_14800 [Clostridium botulinum]|uniref:DUF6338 family protein n=1 Tax=Clostridium botulinum TaxID=1491 RepID=UPI000774B27D|nr:DUF6338 family protein [Clostridium botulinum]NFL87488.1 hypothetical protein [Clostridium botulinum]NFO22500.1 hypothetical protein [Clostridium botulinum]